MLRIKAEKLINAIEAISLVPSRSGIVPSEFIQLEQIGATLYLSLAAEIYGRVRAKGTVEDKADDWIFHVDRSSFIPFVLLAKAYKSPRDFVISYAKKRLTVSSGHRKVVFNKISFIEGYPKYSDSTAVTLPLSERQRKLLQLASCYASPDPTVAHLNCVLMLQRRAILASNRITLMYAANPDLPLTIPLPLALLGVLNHDFVKAIEVAKKSVKLVLNCGYLVQALNVTAKKDFPAKQILGQFKRGKKYPVQFRINAPAFLKALTRLKVCIEGVVSRELVVHFQADKNEKVIKLFCDTPQGRFSEIVKLLTRVKALIDCELLLLSLTPLEVWMSTLKQIEVRYDDAQKSPYHFITQDGIEVILSRNLAKK